MEKSTLAIITALQSQMPFAAKADFMPNISHVTDNKKVSDHHAIIPTLESTKTDIKSRSIEERAIYYLIAQRLLCASAEPMRYLECTVTAECEGAVFTAKGKTILHKGWTAIEEAFSSMATSKKKRNVEEEIIMIPENAKTGTTIPNVKSDVTEHFTSPPKPYTEDTLLSAMERAGNGEFDKETEKKGLGTPATRASIIEKLVSAGYATRSGKQITASDDAVNMIEILPDTITSPMLTAEWENKLLQMEKGLISESEFMNSITELVKNLIADYSNVSDDARSVFVDDDKADSIGICPRCGNAVEERKLSYCCMAKGCDFVLWKDNKFMQSIGLNFTKKVAAALVSDGSYIAKNLISKKTGNKYNAKITVIENGGKYPAYHMEILQERKKSKER